MKGLQKQRIPGLQGILVAILDREELQPHFQYFSISVIIHVGRSKIYIGKANTSEYNLQLVLSLNSGFIDLTPFQSSQLSGLKGISNKIRKTK